MQGIGSAYGGVISDLKARDLLRKGELSLREAIGTRTVTRVFARQWRRPAGCSARLWKKVGAEDPFLPKKKEKIIEEERQLSAAGRFVRIDNASKKKEQKAKGGGKDVPPWLAKLRAEAARKRENSGETEEPKQEKAAGSKPSWMVKMEEQAAQRKAWEAEQEGKRLKEQAERRAEAERVKHDPSLRRSALKSSAGPGQKKRSGRMGGSGPMKRTTVVEQNAPGEEIDRRPPIIRGPPKKQTKPRSSRMAAGRTAKPEAPREVKTLTMEERRAQMAALKRGPTQRQARAKPQRMAAGRTAEPKGPQKVTELTMEERQAQMRAMAKGGPAPRTEPQQRPSRMAAGRTASARTQPTQSLTLEERRAQMAALKRGPGGSKAPAAPSRPAAGREPKQAPKKTKELTLAERQAALVRPGAVGQPQAPEPAKPVPAASGGGLDDLFGGGGERTRLRANKPKKPAPKTDAPVAKQPSDLEKRQQMMAAMRARAKEEALAAAAIAAAKDGRKLESKPQRPKPRNNSRTTTTTTHAPAKPAHPAQPAHDAAAELERRKAMMKAAAPKPAPKQPGSLPRPPSSSGGGLDDLFGGMAQMEGRQRLSRAKKKPVAEAKPAKAQPSADDLAKRKEMMRKAREKALAEAQQAAKTKK